MLIVSCRKNGDSNRNLEPGNLWYSDGTGFVQKPSPPPVKGKTCILVHGYHNPIESVLENYVAIEAWRSNLGYDHIIGYTWPGCSTCIGYPLAVRLARGAGLMLGDLIASINGPVDLQTHSLGARVALVATKKSPIRTLFMAAPAVDYDKLMVGGEFERSKFERAVVFHSKHDRVLRTIYRLGDVFDGEAPAMGLNGSKFTGDRVENVDMSEHVKEHGGYVKTTAYFEAWGARV